MKHRWIFGLLLLFCGARAASARSGFGAPSLMPPNGDEALYESSSEAILPSGNSTGLGFELGALARKSPVNDVAGMQLLPGGRIFLRVSPCRKIFIKPSLGFFFRSQTEGTIGVNDYSFEGGGNIYFTPFSPGRAQWYVGTAQHVEALLSQSTLSSSSGTSPVTWRFRMGPATGVAYALDKQLSLVSDLEATSTFTQPWIPYLGLTAGLIWKY